MEEDRNLPVVEEEPQQEDQNLPMEIEESDNAPREGTEPKQAAAKPAAQQKERRKIPARYLYIVVGIFVVAALAYFLGSGSLAFVFTTSTTSTTSTSTSTTSTTTINPFNQGTLAHYLAANRGGVGLAALSGYLNANVSSIGPINAGYGSVLKVNTGGNFTSTINSTYRIVKYLGNISMALNRSSYRETDVANQAGTYLCIATSDTLQYQCVLSTHIDVLNESFNPLTSILRTGNSSIATNGSLSDINVISTSQLYANQSCTLFSSKLGATSILQTPQVGRITNVLEGNLTECVSNSYWVPLFSSFSGVLNTSGVISDGNTTSGTLAVLISTNAIYLNHNASSAQASTLPGKIVSG
ncbi:MAG: hypothetical protein KGH59_02105 [Candidatus Micrarchaeota archaeon]|nr:hypothetical protein [Candidatus Micrarchaeota archaeon]